jgi:hypothetical protein
LLNFESHAQACDFAESESTPIKCIDVVSFFISDPKWFRFCYIFLPHFVHASRKGPFIGLQPVRAQLWAKPQLSWCWVSPW